MHLSTEESAVSWMWELFGEVGGDVPEFFSADKFFRYIFKYIIVWNQNASGLGTSYEALGMWARPGLHK